LAFLWIVSLIWAFSFGIIKNRLAGLDASLIAAARLLIATLALLPFLRLHGVPRRLRLQLALTGAVQLGLMYIAYNLSFGYLQAYEVALFTIFTPLYVTLIYDALHRRLNLVSLGAALLAVAGTALVKGWVNITSQTLWGFGLVQLSNLCFAFGQVKYRELMRHNKQVSDLQIFALLMGGGALTALLAVLLFPPAHALAFTREQALALLYLGGVASGLGFWLWNAGSRRVSAGSLAVFNDLKIPLAVAVSLLVFGEQTNLPRLLLGGALVLAALLLNERFAQKPVPPSEG
jgi:drug/metabolite transporter (DMT)-like permease